MPSVSELQRTAINSVYYSAQIAGITQARGGKYTSAGQSNCDRALRSDSRKLIQSEKRESKNERIMGTMTLVAYYAFCAEFVNANPSESHVI